MKILATIAVLLLLVVGAVAQRPQPFIAGGGILNAGDAPAGAVAIGGFEWDTKRLTTLDYAEYDTGGKSNDNTNTSSTGHSRGLDSMFYFRTGKWGFGLGAEWDKTYTPNYDKSSVHPRAGFMRDFETTRLTVNYVHPGTDWHNAVQGAEVSEWFGHGHLFANTLLGVYEFHATITDPSDAQLTASEKSQHHATAQFHIIVGWRF